MNIIGHTIEKVEDTIGILSGDRYEFFIDVEVPEEDDLFSELGLRVKVIYAQDEKGSRIVQYDIYEKETEKFLEFELEDEELSIISDYCKQHID
ncbi:pullulanase [Anaerobacillus alkalidiazotrophicus]|uniref:Pullulanase n=1 Tax=Anaerobacillus alkalidiazotrophicus TaxID=472963 RepID=A0A1S2M7U4_9BACI|nr:DUF6509 family protein [Anaerobacillus alkalidiazotrophicus]OIJ20789.1 pullulanase [Anaerobacillus alkalidiazotrophicus]